ncbi:MBL fold metallo-hydrolase, partial [Enterobacter roggenkampii]|uniref:MBL fold metallo-hydrolase n=1 Tax=Enterobacter roggenkampii TaxID=1812935 RepID=UPI003BEF29BB
VLGDPGLRAGVISRAGTLTGRQRRMSRRLSEAAGTAPEAVDVVVLTHCHTDHIGGLMRDGHPAVPNARLVVGATEYEFWA